MQIELKQIQQEVGITFIYVTHDQGEALTMSDRLAVFNEGRIEQLGAPAEVYERPTTSFVAGFVGTSNLLTGDTARRSSGGPARSRSDPRRSISPSQTPPSAMTRSASGRIRAVSYLGPDTRYWVALDAGSELIVISRLSTTSTEALARKARLSASSGSDSTGFRRGRGQGGGERGMRN